jgi:hypothetical protein
VATSASDQEPTPTVDAYGPRLPIQRKAIIIAPIAPDDGFSTLGGMCSIDGHTPSDGTYLICTRSGGHEGNHWDSFDRVYFKVEVGL